MKKRLLFLLLMVMLAYSVSAQIPVLEFNFTRTGEENVFARLPHRFLPIKSDISWVNGTTTYFNLDKLLILPEGNYVFSYDEVEGLNILIDQSTRILRITPEPGWFGNEKIVVYIDAVDASSQEKIQEISQNKLLLEEINFDEVDTIFDDFLYGLFNAKLKKLVDERKDINYIVDINAEFRGDFLDVNVGDDVKILTSFYQDEVGKKPKVDILIDAQNVDISGIIDHCFDDVKNYDEAKVDCGGSCKECKEFNYDFLVIIIVVIAIVSSTSYYLIMAKKKEIRKETIKEKPSIKIVTIEKIKELENRLEGEDVKIIFKEFNIVIREYFIQAFHIRYRFTYDELRAELKDKKISQGLQDRLEKFFVNLSHIRYSQHRIKKDELKAIMKEIYEMIAMLK